MEPFLKNAKPKTLLQDPFQEAPLKETRKGTLKATLKGTLEGPLKGALKATLKGTLASWLKSAVHRSTFADLATDVPASTGGARGSGFRGLL